MSQKGWSSDEASTPDSDPSMLPGLTVSIRPGGRRRVRLQLVRFFIQFGNRLVVGRIVGVAGQYRLVGRVRDGSFPAFGFLSGQLGRRLSGGQ